MEYRMIQNGSGGGVGGCEDDGNNMYEFTRIAFLSMGHYKCSS